VVCDRKCYFRTFSCFNHIEKSNSISWLYLKQAWHLQHGGTRGPSQLKMNDLEYAIVRPIGSLMILIIHHGIPNLVKREKRMRQLYKYLSCLYRGIEEQVRSAVNIHFGVSEWFQGQLVEFVFGVENLEVRTSIWLPTYRVHTLPSNFGSRSNANCLFNKSVMFYFLRSKSMWLSMMLGQWNLLEILNIVRSHEMRFREMIVRWHCC